MASTIKVANASQCSKLYLAINVQVLGILNHANEVQPAKVYCSIETILPKQSNLRNELHPLKALVPKTVTVSGILTSVNLEQSLK